MLNQLLYVYIDFLMVFNLQLILKYFKFGIIFDDDYYDNDEFFINENQDYKYCWCC